VIWVRVTLVLVATALAAVFAVGLRASHLGSEGDALAVRGASLDRATAAHADDLLRRAARLTPDTSPDVARAGLLSQRGDHTAAIAVVRSVLRREPRNVTAWIVLSVAAKPVDPALSRAARRRAAELAPAVPEPPG
jgi:predicted Zn-dependent protease